MLRLLIFLALCALIYFFYDQVQVVIPAVVACLALFIFLISRHSGLKREKDKMDALISINETEIHVLETGDFLNLPDGKEFDVEDHEFSRDIDLFGRKSFFQYLNRTALAEGASKLSSFLLSNDINSIEEKQEAIKELANKADWRQEFSATATLVRTENSSKTILKWIANYKAFVPAVMRGNNTCGIRFHQAFDELFGTNGFICTIGSFKDLIKNDKIFLILDLIYYIF